MSRVRRRPPRRWAGAWRYGALVLTCACALERDVEVALPPYDRQPAVEAYLTPGEPFTLLLTRSSSFFDSFPENDLAYLDDLLLSGAEVRVRYGDEEVVLTEGRYVEPFAGRFANYGSEVLVPANYADSFFLEIDLADGTGVRAGTLILPPVPISENVVSWGPPLEGDSVLASLTTYLVDPDPSRVNYFHKVVTHRPIDSTVTQEFAFSDEFADQARLSTGTDFAFERGDTVYVYLAHVDAAYERYAISLLAAVASNGNPFAQPSPILGNVRGIGGADPLGIFTGYAYVRERVVIGE